MTNNLLALLSQIPESCFDTAVYTFGSYSYEDSVLELQEMARVRKATWMEQVVGCNLELSR